MSDQIPDSALMEFFTECDEILQRFSMQLSAIEKTGKPNKDQLSALYREMHTLKGSSQLFGFKLMGQIAHSIEACLEPIRRHQMQIPPRLMDLIFKAVDLLEALGKASQTNKKEPVHEFESAVQDIVPKLLHEASEIFDGNLSLSKELEFPYDDAVTSSGSSSRSEEENKIEVIQQKTTLTSIPPRPQISVPDQKKENKITTQKETPVNTENMTTTTKNTEPSVDATATVRIQVSLLDKLMNLMGEMVLVRNQVLQYATKHEELEFLNMSQKLDIVTTSLQGEVMKTRMQPIGSVLDKFQRIIRDLAKELGKQIELTIKGSETEVDKTLLEAIKDPLTHIMRNSCDHGLETPEERTKNGKNPVGHISVSSFHEGGQVVVEIQDDGRGLNYERILNKALEKGILTQDKAKSLNEKQIANLIFAPGFSTAEKVSAVSGRGVGMDVVRTNLEKIGGQVEIDNFPGKGMIVRLRIPLTLAIVPALIVRTGKEQFAIPQVKLQELVRVENNDGNTQIEMLQGRPVYRLRGDLLPLVNLSEVLKVGTEPMNSVGKQADGINIVVLSDKSESFGLIVDEIKDTAEIVVKPIPNYMKKLGVYSGATIMGDGNVALILDITGLKEKANLLHLSSQTQEENEIDFNSKTSRNLTDAQDFLFFKLDSKEKYCLPLCLVHRLEEFEATEVELSGSQRIVKYRDSILPLVSLNEYLKLPPSNTNREKISAIVVQKRNRSFGIEVNEVVDILNINTSIQDPVKEIDGILGSVITDEGIATVIDVLSVLSKTMGEITNNDVNEMSEMNIASSNAKKINPKNIHILFAEDTIFFAKQVMKILENTGYRVTHVPDGQEAWNTLSSASTGEFQILVSDIEMPHMTGFDLAEKVREDSRFKNLPLIAVTTRFRDADREKGAVAGFTHYLEKLKSDELLETISSVLRKGG
jgi:two-component system, chemotaxis family, sensor kinase CheA